MNTENKHLGLRIDAQLHYKLHHIAVAEGRSANGEILFLLRRYIAEYERAHGAIVLPSETNEPEK